MQCQHFILLYRNQPQANATIDSLDPSPQSTLSGRRLYGFFISRISAGIPACRATRLCAAKRSRTSGSGLAGFLFFVFLCLVGASIPASSAWQHAFQFFNCWLDEPQPKAFREAPGNWCHRKPGCNRLVQIRGLHGNMRH